MDTTSCEAERPGGGSILVFGSNDSAQLGIGVGPETVAEPTRLPVAVTLKALSLAETHGAFATTDGEMYTWGSNFSGQVGRGAVEAQAPEHASPGRVQALEGWSIADVACGSEHTIAAAGPSLFCFGSNEVGQCGIGDDGPLTLPKPKLLKALRGIRVAQVAAGDSHSLALTTCGTVLSWGGNTHGQLGHGDTLNRFVPVPVSALWALPVVQIAAGEAHSLALTAGGCVFSFGRNRSGQLGLSLGSSPAMPGGERRPVHLSRKPPVNLKFLSALMGMGITRAMAEHALQVTGNRSVEEAAEWIFTSTHDGVPGEIGADGGAPQTHAQQHDIEERALVPMMVLLRGVSQISAGGGSSACVKDGTAYTWGEGRQGQLGHGTLESQRLPGVVEGLLSYTVTQVASGREHTLFLTSSGAVFGAGSGQLGQLAHAGAGRTLLVPEKVWEGGAAVIAGGFSSAVVGEGAGGHVVLGKRPITLGEGIWEGMEGCIARIQSLKARADSQTPQVRADVSSEVDRLAGLLEEAFGTPNLAPMMFAPGARKAAEEGADGDIDMEKPGRLDKAVIDFEEMEAFYKRLLGTMEGGVVEALFRAQVQLTEALDTNTTALSSRERLVPALPLLLSPLLGQTAMATKIVPKLCESLLRTPPKGRALLIQWLAECPIDILAARLVRPIQSFITEKMKRDNALSGAVIYAIELLAVVNEAELSKPAGARMPVVEMYNDFVSEHMDVLDHYKAWRRPGTAPHRKQTAAGRFEVELSFCDYPFLLNCQAKSKVLRTEARVQMAESVNRGRAEYLHRMLGLPSFMHAPDDCVLPQRRKRRLHETQSGPSTSVQPQQPQRAMPHGRQVVLDEGLGGLLSALLPSGFNFMGMQMAVAGGGAPGPDQGGASPGTGEGESSAGGAPHDSGLPAPDACGFPATHPENCILRVRRENLVEDALEEISRQKLKDLAKPLKVHFIGEEGVDDGGLRKEFFQLLTQQILSPNYSMFAYQPETRTYYLSPVTLESETEFLLVGIAISLAIYNGVLLDVSFPQVLYKKLLDMPVGLDDLAGMSPSVERSLQALLDFQGPGSVEDVFALTFSSEIHRFGQVEEVPLKPGGQDIPVTEANREEYVGLYVDHVLNKSVEATFESFRRGFLMLAGGPALQLFRPEELEMMVCGMPHLDFKALREAAKYEGFTPDSTVVQWLWEIVERMDLAEKRRFLKFFSGSDRAPVGGLGKLQMVIQRDGPDTHRLPTSRTCFNVLLLPEYSSRGKLGDRLLTAINNSEGFGLQ